MIKIKDEELSESDLVDIVLYSEIYPEFSIKQFVWTWVIHGLCFGLSVPGYLLAYILQLINGGQTQAMHNLRFIGELEPVRFI